MVVCCLTRWEWLSDEGSDSFSWRIPEALGLIDLRTLPQMSVAGGLPQGYALATFLDRAAAPRDSVYLGDDPVGSMFLPRRQAMNQELGVSELIRAESLSEAIWILMSLLGDPTGQAMHKPLMPTIQGQLEYRLRGLPIWGENFRMGEHPSTSLVRGIIQEDYRQLILQGDLDHCAKVVDALCIKYHTNSIGLGLEEALRMPHSTRITDDFNRVDADALGTSPEGWSWTEVNGDMDIVSNRARTPTNQSNNGVSARAEIDLSSVDHHATGNVSWIGGTSLHAGLAVRFASAADTYYRGSGSANSEHHRIWRFVAGVRTQLFTANLTLGVETLAVDMEANGSTLDCDIGASNLSGTDTAITGGTRTGIGTHSGSGADREVDVANFLAADLGDGPSVDRGHSVGRRRQFWFSG